MALGLEVVLREYYAIRRTVLHGISSEGRKFPPKLESPVILEALSRSRRCRAHRYYYRRRHLRIRDLRQRPTRLLSSRECRTRWCVERVACSVSGHLLPSPQQLGGDLRCRACPVHFWGNVPRSICQARRRLSRRSPITTTSKVAP
jgi:hypothetical protein